jgi:hypothetical protein
MPYLVMQRADIPNGVLQVEDLRPNTSQKNSIYEPGLGQSGYVRQVPTPSTVATTAAAPDIFIVGMQTGLAAYLIDTVEDASTAALTAAVANAAAAGIIARVRSGLKLEETDVDAELITAGATGGTTLTGLNSTATLAEVLEQLQGAVYEVPDGAQIQAAGAFVPLRVGSFAPDITVRTYYVTGALRISNGEGKLAGYKRADFEYEGVQGPAVVVYADDGTLFV